LAPNLGNRIDDIAPVTPGFDHLGKCTDRMLTIGIHHHDRVSRNISQPCQERRLLAKVPAQLEYLDPVVRFPELKQPFKRSVCRTIVHNANRGLNPAGV
jgi:hypothetical protein